MATRIIDDTKLNDIAVAIQAKDSGGQMTVDEMPTRIEAIPTGSTLIPKTIAQNGVYNASSDNADGYDVVTVDVPEKNTLDEYFANTLEVANIPSATSLPTDFFYNYTALKSVNAPNLTNISYDCFAFCSNLETINITTTVTRLEDYAFYHCHKLILTALPNTIIKFGRACFSECVQIPFLDMSEFNSIPVIGVNAFEHTNFPFYFRDQQQLDEWAAATNWSTYADRFQIKPRATNYITQAKDTIGGTALYNGTGYKQDYRWISDNTEDNVNIPGVPNKFAVGYIELEPGDVVHFYGDILKGESGSLFMHIQSSSNTRLVRATLSNWTNYTNRPDIMATMTDIDYDTTTNTLHSFKWTGGTNAVKGYMHLTCVGTFTEGVTVVTINEEM